MKYSLLFATAIVTLCSGPVQAGTVQATVTRQEGKVSCQDPAGNTRPLHVGNTVTEGSLVITGPGAAVALRGVPGSRLALDPDSQVRIVGMAVEPGVPVAHRQMTLELMAGGIHCTVEPGKSGVTILLVVTPQGRLTTVALTATIRCSKDVTEITTAGGRATVTPNGGGALKVESADYLRIGPGGTEITDLKTGRITDCDPTGTTIEERPATAQELETGRNELAIVLSDLQGAVAEGTISKGFAGRVAEVLKEVNATLSAAGLAPLDLSTSVAGAAAVGGGAVGGSPLPGLSGGSGGGAANPANLSGAIRSREN